MKIVEPHRKKVPETFRNLSPQSPLSFSVLLSSSRLSYHILYIIPYSGCTVFVSLNSIIQKQSAERERERGGE